MSRARKKLQYLSRHRADLIAHEANLAPGAFRYDATLQGWLHGGLDAEATLRLQRILDRDRFYYRSWMNRELQGSRITLIPVEFSERPSTEYLKQWLKKGEVDTGDLPDFRGSRNHDALISAYGENTFYAHRDICGRSTLDSFLQEEFGLDDHRELLELKPEHPLYVDDLVYAELLNTAEDAVCRAIGC